MLIPSCTWHNSAMQADSMPGMCHACWQMQPLQSSANIFAGCCAYLAECLTARPMESSAVDARERPWPAASAVSACRAPILAASGSARLRASCNAHSNGQVLIWKMCGKPGKTSTMRTCTGRLHFWHDSHMVQQQITISSQSEQVCWANVSACSACLGT